MNALEFRHVTKRFDERTALDDVSLTIPRRSIVGLVGRNGSGKTTLLHHVTGMVLPTSGSCLTFGTPSGRLGAGELARIGMTQQHETLIPGMTVRQLLRYVASFHTRWDDALERQLLDAFDVDPGAKVGTLSPGLRQKVSLIVATGHHPELLLLDEPLSDLDPYGRREVLGSLLERFRDDETTIVISSHLLHDIEPVIDRVLCLDAGRVVAFAELDELKEQHGQTLNLEQLFLALTRREPVSALAHHGGERP